jgi:hypothetical protein
VPRVLLPFSLVILLAACSYTTNGSNASPSTSPFDSSPGALNMPSPSPQLTTLPIVVASPSPTPHSTPSPTPHVTPTPHATPSPSPQSTPTPSSSPSPQPSLAPSPLPSPTPNLTAARNAAALIIVPLPGATGVWVGCAQVGANFSKCPFDSSLISRLNYLSGIGYWGDAPPGVCGEDYLTGTQNGLYVAPIILSVTLLNTGSVRVVIKRGSVSPPNLTATMTLINGHYLATDLASGSGVDASIFSSHPNC